MMMIYDGIIKNYFEHYVVCILRDTFQQNAVSLRYNLKKKNILTKLFKSLYEHNEDYLWLIMCNDDEVKHLLLSVSGKFIWKIFEKFEGNLLWNRTRVLTTAQQ